MNAAGSAVVLDLFPFHATFFFYSTTRQILYLLLITFTLHYITFIDSFSYFVDLDY